jgi:hypothetical protein
MQTRTLFFVASKVTALCVWFGINTQLSVDAAEGDILVLDILDSVQQMNWTDVEWLWLVEDDMVPVLQASTYSFSSDKRTWVFTCFDLSVLTPD